MNEVRKLYDVLASVLTSGFHCSQCSVTFRLNLFFCIRTVLHILDNLATSVSGHLATLAPYRVPGNIFQFDF